MWVSNLVTERLSKTMHFDRKEEAWVRVPAEVKRDEGLLNSICHAFEENTQPFRWHRIDVLLLKRLPKLRGLPESLKNFRNA